MEKVVLALESLFWPANGVRSTHLLVEIHNMHTIAQYSAENKVYFTNMGDNLSNPPESSTIWQMHCWKNGKMV